MEPKTETPETPEEGLGATWAELMLGNPLLWLLLVGIWGAFAAVEAADKADPKKGKS